MKRWQNWLVPVLTFLTVFVLALLPRQASLARDRQLSGGVHSEDLSSDSNFPFRPPAMAERFDMVSRWYLGVEYGEFGYYEEYVTEVYQHTMDLEEQPEMCRQITEELEALAKERIIPEELRWEDTEFFNVIRIYLRDIDSLAGASFLVVDYFDKFTGWCIHVILDEESGHVVNMQIYMDGIRELLLSQLDIPQIGDAFLNRLGLESTLESANNISCNYSLAGSRLDFLMLLTGDMLLLAPQIVEPEDFYDSDSAVSSSGWKK